MECPLHCSLATADGSRKETIEAIAVLQDESLRLLDPAGGEEVLDLREIVCIEARDRAIRITMTDGRDLFLDRLAGRQDEFLCGICGNKNRLAVADLLSAEVPRIHWVVGELRRPSPSGNAGPLEKCELRVYRDCLAVVPKRGELLKLPTSRLASVGVERYSLAVRLDDGSSMTVSKLGRELEPTRRSIADSITESRSGSLTLLKGLLPDAEAAALEPWAKATAGGRMVKLADLEASLPGATEAIARRLESAGLGDECRHLASIGSGEITRVGLRRRIRGTEATEDIWTLVPIVLSEEGRAGNALALVGTDEPQPVRATYFFRIIPRESFRAAGGVIDEPDVASAMDAVGSALESTDFKREPLALTDQDIASPENAPLRHSLNLIPGSRELRQRFIGRVVHSLPERWAERTGELLRFNVSAARDDDLFA